MRIRRSIIYVVVLCVMCGMESGRYRREDTPRPSHHMTYSYHEHETE